MSSNISILSVSDAILKGLVKAESDYRKWSGDDWLWRAPEYLLTIYAAKQISRIKERKYLTLENGTRKAINDAGAKGRGKLHNAIRENGRVDILLWWAKGDPRAIIEIKNGVYSYRKIRSDVHRISQMLKRKKADSSLQFGIISFYMSRYYKSSNPKDMLEKQIQKLLEQARIETKNICTVTKEQTEIYIEDEHNAWCCVNLIFKPQS